MGSLTKFTGSNVAFFRPAPLGPRRANSGSSAMARRNAVADDLASFCVADSNGYFHSRRFFRSTRFSGETFWISAEASCVEEPGGMLRCHFHRQSFASPSGSITQLMQLLASHGPIQSSKQFAAAARFPPLCHSSRAFLEGVPTNSN